MKKKKIKEDDRKFYTYRFRIYPTTEQESFFQKQMDANRFVYNFFLERQTHLYNQYGVKSNYNSNAAVLTLAKKGFPFLKEVNSQSLQQILMDLEDAFHKFYKKQGGYPNFKKKGVYNSIKIPDKFKIENNHIFIPKINKSPIKVKFHRKVYEQVKSISISKTTSGKYYVNMLVEKFKYSPYIPKKSINVSTGIDVGIKDFATITTGRNINDKQSSKIPNPKFLFESMNKLVKLSRQLDRKQHKRTKQDKTVSSKNYIKCKNKVSKLHEHITNQRNDFLHKLSSMMVNDSQVIVVEDLNIKGMVKNKKLSKSIVDVSWSKFFQMFEYKSNLYGRTVFKVNRFYPSSKTCSTPGCNYIHKDLKLSERYWTCPECHTVHDRDVNASINLFLEGLKQIGQELSEFTPVEYAPVGYQVPGISCHTLKQETTTFI